MTNLNGDSGELVEGNICPRDSCYRREPCPPEIRFICEYEYDTPKENETPKSDLVEQLENCAIIFEGEPDLADIFIRALSNHAELSERVRVLEAGLATISAGEAMGHAEFKRRLGERTRPTWYAVNALQEYLAASGGHARALLTNELTAKRS